MTIEKINTGLHLEGLFGNVLALSTAVVERMRQTEPDMYAKAVHLVETGLGSLEARVLIEPEPLVILLIRTDPETALEIARLRVPDITARH
jgi:hypothetical protein